MAGQDPGGNGEPRPDGRTVVDVHAHHDLARYTWELVGPDRTVAVTGTKVVALAEDGRLRGVAGCFGDPPARAA